ncbi:MAG: rhodanese-like domain-containing protein [Candidatus Peribacter sp.]|nr:rhodanese-like domain-containing protein [Candidatus Peribacter sp.]
MSSIKECFILDVRTEGEFEEKSIEGSTNIPHRKILVVEYPGSIGFALTKIPKDKKIVVYCKTGSRATQAAKVLTKKGYSVINLLKFEQAEDFVKALKEREA